jgi:excisionase family DNA binding protein
MKRANAARKFTKAQQLFDNKIASNDLRFDRLVSPKTAAGLLDVSLKFIYESIARGDLPAEHVGGRLRRIRLSTLESWLTCQPLGGKNVAFKV